MRRPVRQALARRQRGQALVLGALCMLMLALTMAASFNLSQALHEKIRLQQHTDASAYSMAVVEARAMNYFAYSNRAMAAAYAAMTSLHAYMSAMSVTGEMMKAASSNFQQIAGIEFALCAPCCCNKACGCATCKHCLHGIKALSISGKFSRQGRSLASSASGLDSTFESAVNDLDRMIDAIHLSQLSVLAFTANTLRGENLARLREVNAPSAQAMPAAVGAININELGCALEGTLIPCLANGRDQTPRTNRSQIMTEVANAARPPWAARRDSGGGSALPLHLNPSFLMDLQFDIQGEDMTVITSHKGTAKVTDSASAGSLRSTASGNEGLVVGAEEHGSLFSVWKDGVGSSSYSTEVYSDSNGGSHKPGRAHSGNHDFEGVQAQNSCVASGNCFINFRSTDDKDKDFGQPHLFAYFRQDLGLFDYLTSGTASASATTEVPWALNSSGSVAVTHGDQGEGKVDLLPGQGAAMSNAMVYYHRPGNWREHPNLFKPYWRAKLQPFTTAEATAVLSAAGDSDAAALAAAAPPH